MKRLTEQLSDYETIALFRFASNIEVICRLFIDYDLLRIICSCYLDDSFLRPGLAVKHFIDHVEKIDNKIHIYGLKVVCFTQNHDGIHCGNSKPHFHRHTYKSFRIIF